MDFLSFIASLVKSLAWPGVLFAGLILFKGPVSDLIGSVRKISLKDTAVEFDRKAREVKATIAAERGLPVSDETIGAEAYFSENIVRIVEAWAELEDIIRKRAKARGLNEETMSGGPLLKLARQQGLLTDDQARSLLGLNQMRNLAVHGRKDEIDHKRTEEFLVLAEAIKTVLEISKPPETSKP